MLKSFFIYWSAFGISLYFARRYEKYTPQSRYKKIILFLLIILPTVLVSGFRSGVGTDYQTYARENQFIRILGLKYIFIFYQEPGWFLVSLISSSERVLFLLSSFLYSLFTTLAIIKNRERIGVIFPLFISYMVFYHISFNGIRQAIAVSIFLLALNYIYVDKKKYVLLVIFACLFHKTALFTLAFLFISDKKDKLVLWFLALLVSPVMISKAATLITIIFSRYGIYEKYLTKGSSGYSYMLYLVPSLMLMFFILQARSTVPRGSYFLFKLSLLQIPLQMAGNFLSYADRMAEYSIVAQIFLVPLVMDTYKNLDNRRGLKLIFIIWYMVYYVIMFIVLKSNEVYPYRFDFF